MKVGNWAVWVVLVVNHLQIAGFGEQLVSGKSGKWAVWGLKVFRTLKVLSLRDANAFWCLFWTSVCVSLVSVCVYLLLMRQVHRWNKGRDWKAMGIWAVDYGVMGLGFVPMVSCLLETQFCDDDGRLRPAVWIQCWEGTQTCMFLLAMLSLSAVIYLTAVVCPLLRYQRKGVDVGANGCYLPALLRGLDVFVVAIVAQVAQPHLGMLASLLLSLYLWWCRKDMDRCLCAVHMGLLFCLFTLFLSAYTVSTSLLLLYPVSFCLGFSLIFLSPSH